MNKEVENKTEYEITPDAIISIVLIQLEKIPDIAIQGNILSEISEAFGSKNNIGKGIKVEIEGNKVKINLSILVKFGRKIPDVAFQVQKDVKAIVEQMTSLKVDEVNIHVQGIKAD